MRLIDADAYPCAKCGSAYCITNCDKYWEWFNSTVDAEPVRHGKWIEYTYWIGSFGQINTKCSVCGTNYPCRKGGRGDGKGGKYCEECGAKMDLEEEI